MSVIITNRDMPQDCFDCFMREKCCGKSCSIQYRKVDCSMKSIEGLIDEIEKMKITSGIKNQATWNECLHYVVETIKWYCEVNKHHEKDKGEEKINEGERY